jgi:uncharacterized DUF497 family protein
VRTIKYNNTMIFDFNDEKNKKLFDERGVTFQHVNDSISEKGILLDFTHPNIDKYPEQRIFVVELFEYTY